MNNKGRCRSAVLWAALCFGTMLTSAGHATDLDVDDFDNDGDVEELLSEATAYGLHQKGLERINAARDVARFQWMMPLAIS